MQTYEEIEAQREGDASALERHAQAAWDRHHAYAVQAAALLNRPFWWRYRVERALCLRQAAIWYEAAAVAELAAYVERVGQQRAAELACYGPLKVAA